MTPNTELARDLTQRLINCIGVIESDQVISTHKLKESIAQLTKQRDELLTTVEREGQCSKKYKKALEQIANAPSGLSEDWYQTTARNSLERKWCGTCAKSGMQTGSLCREHDCRHSGSKYKRYVAITSTKDGAL